MLGERLRPCCREVDGHGFDSLRCTGICKQWSDLIFLNNSLTSIFPICFDRCFQPTELTTLSLFFTGDEVQIMIPTQIRRDIT
ncbi:hypothetical protein D3C85_1578880 [compost metagenome]